MVAADGRKTLLVGLESAAGAPGVEVGAPGIPDLGLRRPRHKLRRRDGEKRDDQEPHFDLSRLEVVPANFNTVAAGDAVQIHGGNGFSDEYPVGRFYRNCKAAVIYEGTREIHKIMQADYALGYRQDKPRRIELPAYKRRV